MVSTIPKSHAGLICRYGEGGGGGREGGGREGGGGRGGRELGAKYCNALFDQLTLILEAEDNYVEANSKLSV